MGGLPVVSAGNPAGLLEGAGNPLNWWTPLAGEVTYEGTTTQPLPVMQNMFPSEGTGGSDSNSFQTAIFFATLNVGAGGGSITFGGDDDMFLALTGSWSTRSAAFIRLARHRPMMSVREPTRWRSSTPIGTSPPLTRTFNSAAISPLAFPSPAPGR